MNYIHHSVSDWRNFVQAAQDSHNEKRWTHTVHNIGCSCLYGKMEREFSTRERSIIGSQREINIRQAAILPPTTPASAARQIIARLYDLAVAASYATYLPVFAMLSTRSTSREANRIIPRVFLLLLLLLRGQRHSWMRLSEL